MPASTSYGKYSSYSLYSSYPSYRSPTLTSSYLNRTTSLDRSSYLSSSASSGSSGSSSNYGRYYSSSKGLSALPPRPSDSYRTSRSLRVSPIRSTYNRLSSDSIVSDRDSKYSYSRVRDYSLSKDSGYDSYHTSRDRSIDLQNGNGSISRRSSLRNYDSDYDREAEERVSVSDKIRSFENWRDPTEERLAQRRRRLGLSPAREITDSLSSLRTRSQSKENSSLEERNKKEEKSERTRQVSPYENNQNLNLEKVKENLGCSGGSGPTLSNKEESLSSDIKSSRSRINSFNKDDNDLSSGSIVNSQTQRPKSPVELKSKGYYSPSLDNDFDSSRSSYTLPYRSKERKEKMKERIAIRLASEVEYDKPSEKSSSLNLSDVRGLVGLRNIGNTCFMNSIIQCLSNIRCLLEYIIKEDYLSDINTTLSTMKGELIKAFGSLLSDLWRDGATGPVNTGPFKAQIQRFAPVFTGYAQHDAQEFLRKLLEGLHEDVNRVTQRPKPNIHEIDQDLDDREKAIEAWKRYLRYDDSKIVDMFVGQLKSCLQCSVCGHKSNTFDPFWDLSLPIPSKAIGQVRLSNCLDLFTKEEVLDGDEKPKCSKCNERRKMTKSFYIQKFPKVLVLHLKRFSPHERWRGKLGYIVDFPLDNLDLSNYAACTTISTRYRLISVVNHSGTSLSGHYTAYCKHPYLNTWHEYNDSRVSSTRQNRICSAEAYVLFYELCSY